LSLPNKDWSEEQLRKHADEIRNLLGNYFLRMTSKVIKNRVSQAISSTQAQAFQSLLDRLLVHVDLSQTVDTSAYVELEPLMTVEAFLPFLHNVGGAVSHRMKNLEVAEALHAIVQVLRQVRDSL
jgi:methionyl-tRNA synthetase